MELLAKLDDSSNKWFAVAFSDDTSMGDDAVFECLVLESQAVDLRQSYNSGKSNRLVPDSSGTSSVRMSLKNGNVYCSWKQNSILNTRSKSLDLINKQYHLMLARGPFRSSTGKRIYCTMYTIESCLLKSVGMFINFVCFCLLFFPSFLNVYSPIFGKHTKTPLQCQQK